MLGENIDRYSEVLTDVSAAWRFPGAVVVVAVGGGPPQARGARPGNGVEAGLVLADDDGIPDIREGNSCGGAALGGVGPIEACPFLPSVLVDPGAISWGRQEAKKLACGGGNAVQEAG